MKRGTWIDGHAETGNKQSGGPYIRLCNYIFSSSVG